MNRVEAVLGLPPLPVLLVGGATEPQEAYGPRPPWSDLVIAADPKMVAVLEQAERAARSNATVLIQGESGTGKEVLARALHAMGDRREAPYVGVNCAALPAGLLETELFGHERGAFTGAIQSRQGRFELASGGTILLDEIGEMPLSLQAKLLRVLEVRAVERVGGSRAVSFAARVVATTNLDLEKEVRRGSFRLDLYYRLNVVRLEVPPLRERPLDIRPLAESFLPVDRRLSRDAFRALEAYDWPGNVRELANVIERAALFGDGIEIDSRQLALPRRSARVSAPSGTLHEVERACILAALDETCGNRTQAAKILGVSIRTLRNRLAEYRGYGIAVPEPERVSRPLSQ